MAQYTGTCTFLVAFAAIVQALLTIRINFGEVPFTFERHHAGGAAHKHADDVILSTHRPWGS
jgi:copper transporter 1